jgi:murein DD-endopeptidase MepM/ murein hydrolase activator NlpD
MSPITAALLGVLTVALAFAPAAFLVLAPPRVRITSGLRIANAVAFEVLILHVGAWAFASVHLRGVAAGALLLGALMSIARSVRAQGPKRGRVPVQLALAVLLVGLDAWALSASWYAEAPVDARLPLAAGSYYVLQGGNSRLTNPFHGRAREVAAIDIVKLTASGNRATRFVASALTDYASFGAPVTSACDGEVVAAEGALPDNPVGFPDDTHPSGNYVVVRCAGGIVKVAHLQHASVIVAVGARVHVGERLASIGNSGETSEPHLHIGAFRLGTPLEVVLDHSGDALIRFDGRILVANDVVTVR